MTSFLRGLFSNVVISGGHLCVGRFAQTEVFLGSRKGLSRVLFVVPANKGLQRWSVEGKFNRVKDIKRPKAPLFTQVDSVALTDELDGKTGFSMVFEGFCSWQAPKP